MITSHETLETHRTGEILRCSHGHGCLIHNRLFRSHLPFSESTLLQDAGNRFRGRRIARGWSMESKGGFPHKLLTAMSPETALAEALAHTRYYQLPETLALPRVLVALRLDAQRVLDLRNTAIRESIGITLTTIKKLDWRFENQSGREAATQAWGDCFCGAGFAAVIAPSAADKAGANLLVFPENLTSRDHFESFGDVKWPEK